MLYLRLMDALGREDQTYERSIVTIIISLWEDPVLGQVSCLESKMKSMLL